jgi:oligopeptide transport system substrate-binding protein
LDPAFAKSQDNIWMCNQLFNGLVQLDDSLNIKPDLAKSWTISEDGKTYTFYLRTNAVWSAGEPITSADVVWSWFRALSPATAGDYAGQLFCIKGAEDYYNGKLTDRAQVGVRALDAHTVRVELNSPLAFFPELCSFPTLAVVPRQTIEQYGDRWLHATADQRCFQPGAWCVNDKVRLLRTYWDAANTAPKSSTYCRSVPPTPPSISTRPAARILSGTRTSFPLS